MATENNPAIPPVGGTNTPPQSGYVVPPPPPLPSEDTNDVVMQAPVSEQRAWALFAHLGGAFLSFLVPLIIMLAMPSNKAEFAHGQAKESLNFQITVFIFYTISMLLMFVGIGFLTFFATWIFAVVFAIVASVQSYKGVYYRYPLTLRLIS